MRVVLMTSARRFSKRDNDRGAAAVEFALVLGVLVLLVFGMIGFGMILHAQGLMAQAAREGARLTPLLLTTQSSKQRPWKSPKSLLSRESARTQMHILTPT
jgi:Flp pilus assembly protein TadG